MSPDAVPLFRAVDVLALSDELIAVANAGSRELLAFRADGSLAWRAGGEGDGPGEFRSLTGLQRLGDTLVAVDAAARRVSLWNTGGEFLETIAVPQPGIPLDGADEDGFLLGLPPVLLGILRDRSAVFRGPETALGRGSPGHRRMTVHVVVQPPAGAAGIVATLPGADLQELRDPGTVPAAPLPMSRGVPLAVAGDRIVWASADRYQIVLFDPDERVALVLEANEPRRVVSDLDVSEYRETWTPWPDVREELAFPERMPAFDRVFIASNDAIWARRFTWARRPEEWIRSTTTEGARDRFAFPEGVRVLDAKEDHAFGVQVDTLGVERLVRLPLP